MGQASKRAHDRRPPALTRAETGTQVAEGLRRMGGAGISEQTIYRRKKLDGGLGPGELRRLNTYTGRVVET